MGTNLAIFILIFGYLYRSTNATCDSQDLSALADFSKGLASPIDNWGRPDCCTWDGVFCEFVSSNTTRVVRVELARKRLEGKISESLAALYYLKVLNLSSNHLTHSIPMQLFHLQHLEVLDLSSNYLTGNLTMHINLTSLLYLGLSLNSLYGPLNGEICKFSRRLQVLDLSNNYFTGQIPATMGNCSLLETLSLGSNSLEGNLPDGLFRLQKLRIFDIQDNRFSGLLSPAFGNLTNVVELDLSFNGFSGIIPDAFDNLQKLERFSGNANRFKGPLPPSLSTSPSISYINLRNNSLNGSVLFSCSTMNKLKSLNLASNLFNGEILENLSSCQSLTSLDLSVNNISSQLPETFKNLASLSYLALSNCSLQNLSATLTVVQHFKNLTVLVLTTNFVHEVMPTKQVMQFNNLNTLVIANCQLTGVVPLWLSGCTKLKLLDLSWNQLSGRIPDFFSNLNFLFYLDFSNNSLSEGIPTGLAKLPSLIYQNLTLQEPSFEFPVFRKRDSSSSSPLKYNRFRSFPPSLDLSSNFLSGPVLPEFGNLKLLHTLNLKSNNLSGPIPDALSRITNLEILDLSHNNLSGTIPPSLRLLSFLSRFSVAYNQLSGSTPTGGQFFTFPDSSFEGNVNLCISLSTSCLLKPREDSESNAVEPPEGGGDDSVIGLPFAVGGATAFVLVVAILFSSRWVFPKQKAKKRIEISWGKLR